MIKSILKIISIILDYVTSKHFHDKQEEQEEEQQEEEIHDAVNNQDTNKINEIINKIRKNNKIIIISAILLFAGCSSYPKIIYVPKKLKSHPLTHEELQKCAQGDEVGKNIQNILDVKVDGWWVPNPIMEELLIKASKGSDK